MYELNDKESIIYNNGERFIPGITHGILELIRHRSTYVFFKNIILSDIEGKKIEGQIKVADLGCGVGHGCVVLSDIPNVKVFGVDKSCEALEYAIDKYNRSNIEYIADDLRHFIQEMLEYDYIVSRHAFEHITDGLSLSIKTKWRQRLMIEVPYGEGDGNEFHVLKGITERDFSDYSGIELFFQDINGITYNNNLKPDKPNGLIYIMSNSHIGAISSIDGIKYPIKHWEPEEIEFRQCVNDYLDINRKMMDYENSISSKINRKLAAYPKFEYLIKRVLK